MLRLALAFAVLSLAATAAHAEPDDAPWQAEMGSSTRWLGKSSAAAVTTDTLSTFVMSVERRLATVELPRGPAIALAAEAELGSGGDAGTMFQTLTTTIGTTELLAGVHASARFYRIVVVSARAAAGAERVSLQIAPTGQPEMASVDDHGWGRMAAASLGLEVEPLSTPRFRLGFGAELGYVATSGVTMHAYPSDRGDPDLTIETAFASIGHLDLDGWSLRISGHISF